MSQRDGQSFFPSPGAEGSGLGWDPNGPYGHLTDITSERGTTIGQRAQERESPKHGWVRGPEETAIPDYMVGPPPGPDPAYLDALQQERADQEAQMDLLLLFS